MQTHNRTNLTLDEIAKLAVIKTGRNNWRNRNIRLCEHPANEDRLISDGITFDGTMRVICDETRAEWHQELSAKGSFVTQ